MEKQEIDKNILDAANEYAKICVNAHHKNMVVGGYVAGVMSERAAKVSVVDKQQIEDAAKEYANTNYEYDIEDSRDGDSQAMRESIAHHNAIRNFKAGIKWYKKQQGTV